MNAIRLAITFIVAAAVEAQSTSRLEIRLSQDQCPESITVVRDGDELEKSFDVHRGGSPCHYETDSVLGGPYYIAKTKFSLRLGGARTDCRVTYRKIDSPQTIGVLQFPRMPHEARTLEVRTWPSDFTVEYERLFRRFRSEDKSMNCREEGILERQREIRDVMFSREDVLLVFARIPMFLEGPPASSARPLLPNDIADIHMKQCAAGRLGNSARLCTTQRAVAAEQLRTAGLQRVVVRPAGK